MSFVKKLYAILFLLVTMLAVIFSPAINAEQYQQGKHYTVLEQPIGDKVEVRELFSFYCPHCFRFEPFVQQLKQALPKDVKIVKNHVDAMPGRDIEIEQMLSKSIIAAKFLKVEAKVAAEIFTTIHQKRGKFTNLDEIAAIFEKVGVSKQKFLSTYNSFQVKMTWSKQRKVTDSMRRQGHSKVPTFVVNGKYIPKTDALKGIDDYKALIIFLSSKPV